jgi:hypothetical protein
MTKTIKELLPEIMNKFKIIHFSGAMSGIKFTESDQLPFISSSFERGFPFCDSIDDWTIGKKEKITIGNTCYFKIYEGISHGDPYYAGFIRIIYTKSKKTGSKLRKFLRENLIEGQINNIIGGKENDKI